MSVPRPPQIMVVDDEPGITKLLKDLLEDELGVQVETFNDPTEAYKRLQEKIFDAISLDHRMPKMTGSGLIKLLRSLNGPNAHTPILVFTGFLEEAEQIDVAALENVLFLEKPIDQEKYLRNIHMALKMKKPKAA